MRILGSPGAFRHFLSTVLLGAALLPAAGFAMSAPGGMVALEDDEMAGVSGAGLAFPFHEFRLEMAPTSYIELIGSDTNPSETTFIRGDLRYYGMSLTRATEGGVLQTGGLDWQGNACSGGYRGLGCPLHEGFIENFSAYDNPYVWRAFNYTGFEPDGNVTDDRAVFEILGPSDLDTFRWAFWGEVESGRNYGAAQQGLAPITGADCAAGTGSQCLTQLQNIIIGKPTALAKPRSTNAADNRHLGPALRFFQYAGTTGDAGNNPATYGLQYLSRLSGDYRLSINTSNSGEPLRGVIPDFTNEEGLYFTDVQAYLPLGQLHYQALVFDNAQPGSTNVGNQDGNIVIQLTRIPNVAAVYNDFYSLAPGDIQGYQRTGRPDRYYETHGYVEWGNAFPTNSNPNALGGTGVSQVRFAGVDPDGPTRQINAANYPGHNSPCAYNQCTYSNQTVGNLYSVSTRQEVVNEGGIAFVSSSESSTWQVLHNQNRAESAIPNATRVRTEQYNCSWLGCWAGSDTRGVLERNPAYAENNANPMLTVNAINLGTARVEGLLINHLRIETLGGGN